MGSVAARHVALIAVGLVFSGCASTGESHPDAPSGAAAPREPEPSKQPQALDPAKPCIQGHVANDEATPLAHAQVALLESNQTFVTADDGAFAFCDLEERTYTVQAQALGDDSVAKRVAAPTPPDGITLVLAALAVKEEFHNTIQRSV